MIARYFDSIWPEYERRVIKDDSGAIREEQFRRIRPFSYYTVINDLNNIIF